MVCCQGQIAIFENFVNQRKTAFIHGSHRQSAIKIAKMQQDCRERLASLEEKKVIFTCFVILSPHDFCIRWLRQWPSKNSKVLQRLLYTTTSQAKQYLRDTEWQSKLDSFNSVSARTVLLFTLNLLCAFSNMYDYSCTPRKKSLAESDTFLLSQSPKSAKLQMTTKNLRSYRHLPMIGGDLEFCWNLSWYCTTGQKLQMTYLYGRAAATLYLNDNTPKKPGKRLRVSPSLCSAAIQLL